MDSKKNLYSTKSWLKTGLYFCEIILVNLLFFVFSRGTIAPNAKSVFEFNPFYGWMAMTITLCYIIGVNIRPISFYLRSSRKGHITTNVLMVTTIEVGAFLLFLFLFGYFRTFFGLPSDWQIVLKVLLFFVAQVILLSLFRVLARWLIGSLRSMGHNLHRVVMVGEGDNLVELCQEMSNSFSGYKVMGYFNATEVSSMPEKIPYLGKVEDVVPYLESHTIHQLYCGLPSVMACDIRVLIDYCENGCVRFFSVPNVRNYLKRQMQMELIGSVPVLMIREDPLESFGNRLSKRTFDLVFSSIFLVFFWLLIYPVIALLTKIFQPGPVFFKQTRNGVNGEEFLCYKFRSMKVNNDSDRLQATKGDARITKFGQFLRKSSIDELPQFINVFKGEMSVVGPRPHMVKHTEEYSALIDQYMVRHWVRPGITGWAQVTGARGETKELWQMKDRINKDIWYIENWSMMLDIRIIFMTIWNAVRGDKQAY